jgi:hypothetical protein
MEHQLNSLYCCGGLQKQYKTEQVTFWRLPRTGSAFFQHMPEGQGEK